MSAGDKFTFVLGLNSFYVCLSPENVLFFSTLDIDHFIVKRHWSDDVIIL